MSKKFTSKEEIVEAIAMVFNSLQLCGDNRPALRAISRIAKINVDASLVHPSKESRNVLNRELHEAYRDLEEGLEHTTLE